MKIRLCFTHLRSIYIYAFSRRFYPKRLTVHAGYTCFISMCVPWESNPQPFALLTQCSTTEPQEHRILYLKSHTPRSILGVCDFLLSDESNWSYIKNVPGLAPPSLSMGLNGCLLDPVRKTSNKVCASIIKRPSHGSGGE